MKGMEGTSLLIFLKVYAKFLDKCRNYAYINNRKGRRKERAAWYSGLEESFLTVVLSYLIFQMSRKAKEKIMVFKEIRRLRRGHNLTQQQVADILGCSREVYRRYETGVHPIPIKMLIGLADYYGVSLDFIVGRTENPEINL